MFGAEFDLEGNLAQLQRGKNAKLSWKPGFVLDEIWAFLPPPHAQTPGLAGSVLSAGVGHGGDVAFGLTGLGAAATGRRSKEWILETYLADGVCTGKALSRLCC